MQSSKVVLGCAMHWHASRRLYLQSWRVESLTEKLLWQQQRRLLLTVRTRLTVRTAGHERKHVACRADIGGCVSGYTDISRVKLSLLEHIDVMTLSKCACGTLLISRDVSTLKQDVVDIKQDVKDIKKDIKDIKDMIAAKPWYRF